MSTPHHTVNAAAIFVPLFSLWANAPLILTITTGILGVIWYAMLIGEKVVSWLNKVKK